MTPAHTKDIMVFFQDQQVCALGDLENIFSYQNQFVEIFLHIIFNVKIKIKQFVKLEHLMTPKKKINVSAWISSFWHFGTADPSSFCRDFCF